MKHIPDIGKMVSDTPRTDNYDWSFHLLFAEAQKMERELNAANERIKNLESALSTVENIDKVNAYQDLESANERIKRLIAERDTARLQSDRNYKLREEFRELLGTDDVEQGVAVVREMKQRINRLESWIESLEVLEQHSGILPEREWFGSEIGYLRKGEAVYKGEAKP